VAKHSPTFRKRVAIAVGAGGRHDEIAKAFSTASTPFDRKTISRWLSDPGPDGDQFRAWVEAERERTIAHCRETIPIANKAYRLVRLQEAQDAVTAKLATSNYPNEGLIRSLIALQREAADEIGDSVKKVELTQLPKTLVGVDIDDV
jgi:hypothetical protein